MFENKLDSLYNEELEQTLLGAILANSSSAMMNLPASLKPESFYLPVHEEIFTEIIKRNDEGKEVNPKMLHHVFANNESLKDVGGASYLYAMVSMAIAVVNIRDYADEVVELATKREIYQVCQNVMNEIDGGSDISNTIMQLDAACQSVAANGFSKILKSDCEIIKEIEEGLKQNVRPYTTGYNKLDIAMDGGLYPSKMYGIVGRKKMGKTIIAGNISYNLAKQNVKHLFIACEMGAKEIHERIMSRDMDIFPNGFRTDYKNTAEFQNKFISSSKLYNGTTIYASTPSLTLSSLKRLIAAAVNKHKITGFILDYWQLVGGKKASENDSKHLDDVAQWLASVCKEFELWGIVMGQQNQDGNTRGSEGLRLACDQLYAICGEAETSFRHIEMMETRYTKWTDIGDENNPYLELQPKGMYFEELS